MRNICLAYWVLLTIVLLASNPTGWLGVEDASGGLLERYEEWSHLICFTLLSTLVFITPWPVGRGWLALVLVAYSAGTEVLQRLVPSRHAELKDFVQDVSGVALGFILACICRRIWHSRPATQATESIAWQRPRRRDATLAAGAPPER
jgi:VanZ family protein